MPVVTRSAARPDTKPKAALEAPCELGPRTYRVLKYELEDLMLAMEADLPDSVDLTCEAERDIVERWRHEMGHSLRDVLGLNITKRLLNIFNPLNVKVHFTAKPDRKYLSAFLKRYNFVAFKRLAGVANTFAAQVRGAADFDALCAARSVHCGAAKITITPIYRFAQCPKRIRTVFCNPEYLRGPVKPMPADKLSKSKNDSFASAKSEDASKSNIKVTKEKPKPEVNKSNITPKSEDNKTEIKPAVTTTNKQSNVKTETPKVDEPSPKAETVKVETPKPVVETKPKVETPKEKVETIAPKVEAVKLAASKTTPETPKPKPVPMAQATTQASNSNSLKPKVEPEMPPVGTKPKTDTPKNITPANVEKLQAENKPLVPKPNSSVNNKAKDTAKVAVQNKNTANVKATPAKTVAKPANLNTKVTKFAVAKTVSAKKPVFPTKKASKKAIEKDDFEELDDHDILALISEGIVLDECSGSDEE